MIWTACLHGHYYCGGLCGTDVYLSRGLRSLITGESKKKKKSLLQYFFSPFSLAKSCRRIYNIYMLIVNKNLSIQCSRISMQCRVNQILQYFSKYSCQYYAPWVVSLYHFRVFILCYIHPVPSPPLRPDAAFTPCSLYKHDITWHHMTSHDIMTVRNPISFHSSFILFTTALTL